LANFRWRMSFSRSWILVTLTRSTLSCYLSGRCS